MPDFNRICSKCFLALSFSCVSASRQLNSHSKNGYYLHLLSDDPLEVLLLFPSKRFFHILHADNFSEFSYLFSFFIYPVDLVSKESVINMGNGIVLAFINQLCHKLLHWLINWHNSTFKVDKLTLKTGNLLHINIFSILFQMTPEFFEDYQKAPVKVQTALTTIRNARYSDGRRIFQIFMLHKWRKLNVCQFTVLMKRSF